MNIFVLYTKLYENMHWLLALRVDFGRNTFIMTLTIEYYYCILSVNTSEYLNPNAYIQQMRTIILMPKVNYKALHILSQSSIFEFLDQKN